MKLKKSKMNISEVQKRDGTFVPFDIQRIINAIYKAMQSSSEGTFNDANKISKSIISELTKIKERYKTFIPTVEGIQDAVEKELILHKYVKTAKLYILYRQKRSEIREKKYQIPEHLNNLINESKKYFQNPLGEFVYFRTYSRWLDNEGRRETWIETVSRYIDFMKDTLGNKLTPAIYEEILNYILTQKIMPSMRLLQFAGKASKSTNVCCYNCAYIAPSKLEDFGEIMYISMCGTGVGFSVESKNIQMLPQIKQQSGSSIKKLIVEDSKEGWANALTAGLKSWFNGNDIIFDYSNLRPSGARLKTIGGKSSGPEPLKNLLNYTREKILKKQGKRLTNIETHDIICKIGEIVVSGGVRRSAMISISDLDDIEMRNAKMGQFYNRHPYRCIANNSAVYEQKPTNEEFLDEWITLMKSGTGERGIFNRGSLYKTLPKRRIDFLKSKNIITSSKKINGFIGVNPCGEIILQSKQFCNLTEIIARESDTVETLLKKAELATILGTYQATLTNFKYLSKEWKENCENEALLGVSITGQWDCNLVRNAEILRKIKEKIIITNKIFSKKFGINQATCSTCVKPSGTVSQTVNCSSGMHQRFSKYYIRRVRISSTDSLFKMLKDQGVPYHPEVGQTEDNATTFVLEFPVKSPKNSVFKDDLTALEQLEYWKTVKINFTEHNPSITIYVDDSEWIQVANWLNENWDIIGGLSFLPKLNHSYKLAPYQEITEDEYDSMIKRFNKIDYSQIILYEKNDETKVIQELACSGNNCEL